MAIQPDARLAMQKTALEVAVKYEQEAKERLRRMSLLAAGLEAVGEKQMPNRNAPADGDVGDDVASDEMMSMPPTAIATGQ